MLQYIEKGDHLEAIRQTIKSLPVKWKKVNQFTFFLYLFNWASDGGGLKVCVWSQVESLSVKLQNE